MAHGHKDYGPGAPTSTVYAVLDMAELAARLGSPHVYDRRGNILFMTNFDGSLSKVMTSAGYGGSVTISNEKAHYSHFSAKLVTPATTGQQASIYKLLAYPVLSKMGVEFSWLTTADPQYLNLLFKLLDGARYWDAKIRLNAAADKWEYQDEAGAWAEAGAEAVQGYSSAYGKFNHIKLIVDWVNKEYVELLVNDESFDLSGKGIWNDASVTSPRLYIDIEITTPSNAARTCYLGHFIVTINEP